MSSIFAIHVETGKELFYKDMLLKQINQRSFESITNVIALETTIQSVRKEGVVTRKLSAIPSYIFIEIAETTCQLPNEVWHFIKQYVPKIKKIFKNSITEVEMQEFIRVIDEKVEDTIELPLYTEKVQNEYAYEEKVKEATHKANTTTGEERKHWLEILKSLDYTSVGMIKQIELLKEKESTTAVAEKCEAFVKSNKPTFRFPLSLANETSQEVYQLSIFDFLGEESGEKKEPQLILDTVPSFVEGMVRKIAVESRELA